MQNSHVANRDYVKKNLEFCFQKLLTWASLSSFQRFKFNKLVLIKVFCKLSGICEFSGNMKMRYSKWILLR